MKRQITIEVPEDDLKRYATFSDEAVQYYNPAIQAVIAEAKRLYPQYEVGQWYKVSFGGQDPHVLFRVDDGWSYRAGGVRMLAYGNITKAVKMVEAAE